MVCALVNSPILDEYLRGVDMTFPQTAQQALEQLKAIPNIKQEYSDFRLSRLFHYQQHDLEGYSVAEKTWVILWTADMLDYQENTAGY
jgi:hypothetical protein